ncbi:MAG: glycosyltransferase [Crocinitomicaceae bacterium]|nr:glycosyltransferase [Crocinitomicaceae bacterium]
MANNYPPISVIIAARNEDENLDTFLPKILKQKYPEFEVIVVNHQSVDYTKMIVGELEKKYSNLRMITIERSPHLKVGKKLPLTVGVKGAKYENLIFTDADCEPASENWLKLMARNFNQKEIVLGYGPYKKQKGFLNKLIRFDTVSSAINYLGLAKAGICYMAVGRNMGYTKDLFFEVGGFKNHYNLISGDDDLFIQEAAKNRNFAVELNPESFVYSEPKKTWIDWLNQKRRHFTTAPEYKSSHKRWIGLKPLSLLIFYITFTFLIISSPFAFFILAIFGFRLIISWILNGMLFARFKSEDLIIFFPFMELIHLVVIPTIYYTNDVKRKGKW